MYRYDEFDAQMVRERVAQFRFQVERRLKGELTEDQFKPFRLMNGIYLELHSYLIRIAIPYGTLNPAQLRKLAHIARRYDKGYGHFTTRQNIQFNWPRLIDIPEILAVLAEVQLHAIQTSGACIRNVTADHFAGAAADEVEDPRPTAELIRQWSSLHPEFSFLPRKFKIAVTASPHDRTALRFHDLGVEIVRNGAIGYRIWVGGGMGRTPYLAYVTADFVAREDLLAYLEAVLRVFNEAGRRDNLNKARIKIIAHGWGKAEMTARIEREFAEIKAGKTLDLAETERRRIAAYFAPPDFEAMPDEDLPRAGAFGAWLRHNVHPHKQPGYAIATLSLKPIGGIPGDIRADQLDGLADAMDEFGLGEIRTSHEQNLVLPHVRQKDLTAIHARLVALGLATANAGTVTDTICCPGLDYCDLANARSIPVAEEISRRFAGREAEIGELKIKISGCINACGHHHAGHIGILGVDKKGVEFYQILLGGSAAEDAAIGEILGPGFGAHEIVDAVEQVVARYLDLRAPGERFLDAVRRLGAAPFRAAAYGEAGDGPD